MNYREKLMKLKDIVNRHIADFTAIDSTITTTENSFLIPNSTQLLHTDGNDTTFDKIFNLKTPNQKDSNRRFFHYKSFALAYKFIEEDYVTASALSNFVGLTDDVQEYEHFFEVIKIPHDKSFIDSQKNDLYILCLTENSNTERFWNDYVSKHQGLCLEFEFVDKRQY